MPAVTWTEPVLVNGTPIVIVVFAVDFFNTPVLVKPGFASLGPSLRIMTASVLL